MSDGANEISRRELLKRGAVVGAGVVWMSPIVQSVGIARAQSNAPSDNCVPSWAVEVIKYVEGPNVGDQRDDPSAALGPPGPDAVGEFVSLGLGGELVVKLGVPYYSGQNGEAIVVETTFIPGQPAESASIEVSSQPDGPWTFVGNANNNPTTTTFALDGVAGLPVFVQYVRIVDLAVGTGDGFDVNAVGVTCL